MIRNYNVRVDVIRNGATLTTLVPTSAPEIDCNAMASIKMSMSGVFVENESVNWLTDEIVPVQIIDGEEFPVGIFLPGTITKRTDENGAHLIAVEAYDRCLILQNTKTEEMLFFGSGEKYTSAIDKLLTDAGVSMRLITPCDATLQTNREDWQIGTDYLTIINALLDEINYCEIWFDSNGCARAEEKKAPTASNIDHEYSDSAGSRLLKRQCSIETDTFNVPNVYIAVCNNPDLEEPMIATAVNDSPASELSVQKRGRRIAEVYKIDNIADQLTLDAYVQNLMFERMMSTETVLVSTANMPGHGVNDTIALIHPDVDGIYREVGWSLLLGPGEAMTHTLQRRLVI